MLMTVSAIAWGTVAIVLLLSFGEGLKNALNKGRQGLGWGIAICWPGQTQKAFAGFPAGRQIRLLPEDVDVLLSNIPEIGKASGEMRTWGAQLSYGDKHLNKRLTGALPVWGELRSQVPAAGGRFINDLDQQLKRRVIFLGNEVKDDLFGDAEAVGQTVYLNRVPFLVVGVLQKKLQMSAYGGPDASNSVIPLSTFEALLGRRYVSNIVFQPTSRELMPRAKKRFYEVLGARYRFDPEDERAIPIWDTAEDERLIGNMTLGIQIFLGIIGGLTLLIGGVGVANIMYAAVAHRTREIGIEMALGARGTWVMGPLVLEALSLTLAGGVVGIGVGGSIVHLLAWVQANSQSEAMAFMGKPTFSLPIALVTVLLLGGIGLLSGFFPAQRAVSIHPAEVLRHE
jgi:putative ABC transport system permease protein